VTLRLDCSYFTLTPWARVGIEQQRRGEGVGDWFLAGSSGDLAVPLHE
jgi:hypothetical protein